MYINEKSKVIVFICKLKEATSHDLIWGYKSQLFENVKPYTNMKADEIGMLYAVSDDHNWYLNAKYFK